MRRDWFDELFFECQTFIQTLLEIILVAFTDGLSDILKLLRFLSFCTCFPFWEFSERVCLFLHLESLFSCVHLLKRVIDSVHYAFDRLVKTGCMLLDGFALS